MCDLSCTEQCKIIKNRKPNLASELRSARGRHFTQPIAYNFTHLSISKYSYLYTDEGVTGLSQDTFQKVMN